MKKPIISIIVPVYNVEQYIEKCIKSLVEQTYKNIEIIFINDGSPDGSRKIITKYEKKYKNIKCIDKENGGQAVARNMALKEAKGEYIMFIDSDDWVSNDMCQKYIDVAVKEDADIVFSSSFYQVENDEEKEIFSYGTEEENILTRYLLTQSNPWNKMIKKELILKNQLFFPEIRAYEDISIVPLWGIKSKKIAYLKDSTYYYLIREGSTMKQTTYNPKLEAIFVSLENLLNKIKNLKNKNNYKDELEWIFIEHLLHGASLRFFQFDNYKDNIKKINKILSTNFPNWKKNKYYQKQSIKYKIVCTLFYKEHYKILKLLLKNK